MSNFVYLGILFNYKATFLHTQKNVSQSRKAVFALCSKVLNEYYNCETLLTLFDTCVSSTLNYRRKVWGNHKADDIEKVHLYLLNEF